MGLVAFARFTKPSVEIIETSFFFKLGDGFSGKFVLDTGYGVLQDINEVDESEG